MTTEPSGPAGWSVRSAQALTAGLAEAARVIPILDATPITWRTGDPYAAVLSGSGPALPRCAMLTGRGAPAIRLVVTNGCSFTYGTDLRDRLTSCWGRVVADALGAQFVNLAAGGGSNRRLVRTTVEQLEDVAADVGVTNSETLFIGMWTELPRWEVYDPAEPETAALSNAFQDRAWHRIGIWSLDRGYRPAKYYYRYLHNDEGDFLDFLLGYVLLEHFLSVKGYARAFTLVQAFPQLVAPDQRYDNLLRNIDDRYLMGGLAGCCEQSFIEVIRSQRLPMSGRPPGATRGDGHPLEEAHRRYAVEWLVPFIRSVIPGARQSGGDAGSLR